MAFFSKNSKYPIGLDISDLCLKVVQLDKVGNKIKIQALGKFNLPKGAIENGEIKNQETVVKSIHKLINKPKFGAISSSEVISCLPDTKTFIKLIEIEKSPNHLKNIIGNEIEKHIPISINESYYDWQIIKEMPDSYLTLIGVAPKYIVKQYIDMFSVAKLSISALEIESMPISRALLTEESPQFNEQIDKQQTAFWAKIANRKKKSDTLTNKAKDKKEIKNKNYGIIDIGAKRTSMIIYAQNTIIMSISMPISGLNVTEQIATGLKIKNDQAEKAKIVCGLDKKKARGIVNGILSKTADELNSRIKKTLDFYENHYPDFGAIDEILLTGGGSNIKNLDKIISEATSIKTEQGNAFINLGKAGDIFGKSLTEIHKLDTKFLKNKKNKTISISQNSSHVYATAVGLALRGIFL